MKKLFLTLIVLFTVLTGCGSGNSEKQTLKVFSPGVYIDPEVIRMFEKEFNCRVIFDEFESNEQMYTKLLSGETYDILVPSDYMVERLIVEEKLQTIDITKLSNYEGLIEGLRNLPSDVNNEYSVPYFWGTVGLLYNTETVDFNDLETQGWNILINPKYKDRTFMYDSERDAFMIAFKALGYSANTDDEAEIEEAYQWLLTQKQTMNPVYVTDESIDMMIQGIKDIAVMYSGDSAYIMTENESMGFYMPKEGTNLWVDSMVIMKDAQNVDLAHEWINFMLDPEIAATNSSYVGYSSIIQEVYDEMSGIGGEYEGIEAYIPRLGYEHDEMFTHNEILRVKIAELWLRVKSAQ